MITCDFEKKGTLSLSEYLYQTIKQNIQNEILKPDEKLPSKRTLAEHLGISIITVANAYNRLISEGYIYSFERKGFFVTDLSDLPFKTKSPLMKNDGNKPQNKNTADSYSKSTRRDEINTSFIEKKDTDENTAGYQIVESSTQINKFATEDLDTLQQNTTSSTQRKPLTQAVNNRNFLVDLKNNSISNENFPFSAWTRIIRNILREPPESLLKTTPPGGFAELREQIASYLFNFRNLYVTPEQIIIGAGTEYLYTLIVQLLGRNMIYAVENPGYKKISSILNLNGVNCIPVNIDNFGIIPEEIEAAKASVIHVSPSHHFPTGVVMPIRRRKELLSWSEQKSSRFIIEDDYDSEFRFNGKPIQPIFGIEETNNVIYINTFSKTLAPSYRISYMILPENLVSLFKTKMSFYSCTVSALEQFALAEFMKQGYFEKHITRMKNYYRNLRNQLIAAFENSNFSEKIKIKEEESGLHFLLTIDTTLQENKIQQNLIKNGIKAPLLSEFYYHQNPIFPKSPEKTLVINYSGIKKEKIPEIIYRFENMNF